MDVETRTFTPAHKMRRQVDNAIVPNVGTHTRMDCHTAQAKCGLFLVNLKKQK